MSMSVTGPDGKVHDRITRCFDCPYWGRMTTGGMKCSHGGAPHQGNIITCPGYRDDIAYHCPVQQS